MEEIRFKPSAVPLEDVQSLMTGIVAVIMLLAGAILFAVLRKHGLLEDAIPMRSELRYVYLSLFILSVMILIELFYYRVYNRNFDFSQNKRLSVENYKNIGRKYWALVVSFSVSIFLYWTFREYGVPLDILDFKLLEKSWYSPFFFLFRIICPICLLFALPYFFLIEKYGAWPLEEDKLLNVYYGYAKLLHFQKPDPYFYNVLKSYLIQFFFVPLMVTFLSHSTFVFEEKIFILLTQSHGMDFTSVQFYQRVYACLYEGIFYIDLFLCVVGYIFASRLLDTHVRSAEPTLLGWLVTVACYQPINRTTDVYINYSAGGKTWGSVLWNNPTMYLVTGVCIILLLIIYVYATAAFGMRFSNLTNKDIISKGPYAIIRHPAYVAKNLTWWLIYLPFLNSIQSVLRLLFWNLIYFIRAITEERHLMHDPHYIEYQKKVKYKFIPFVY
ncbi:MAG: hypothetical protein GY864_05355 [Desulfobacterales bacterium]|nr:hypothetical protein [Desulfobacterales bacterium]